MKFSITAITSALFVQAALAAVAADKALLEKRITCQACSVGPLNAGPACCSASCLAQHGNYHGGHCDENDYCVCN